MFIFFPRWEIFGPYPNTPKTPPPKNTFYSIIGIDLPDTDTDTAKGDPDTS